MTTGKKEALRASLEAEQEDNETLKQSLEAMTKERDEYRNLHGILNQAGLDLHDQLADAKEVIEQLRKVLAAVEVTTDSETSWVHFQSGTRHASLNIGSSQSQIVVNALAGWIADRLSVLRKWEMK